MQELFTGVDRRGSSEETRDRGPSATTNPNKQSVSSTFKNSLFDLMQKMMAATPRFIRCIKPNVSSDTPDHPPPAAAMHRATPFQPIA